MFKYVDGVAWHGYVGGAEAMTKVHDAFSHEGSLFGPRGGPDITSPDYATDWSKWGRLYTGILRNWSQCIVGWNFLLDEKGKSERQIALPLRQPRRTTEDSKTGRLSRNPGNIGGSRALLRSDPKKPCRM